MRWLLEGLRRAAQSMLLPPARELLSGRRPIGPTQAWSTRLAVGSALVQPENRTRGRWALTLPAPPWPMPTLQPAPFGALRAARGLWDSWHFPVEQFRCAAPSSHPVPSPCFAACPDSSAVPTGPSEAGTLLVILGCLGFPQLCPARARRSAPPSRFPLYPLKVLVYPALQQQFSTLTPHSTLLLLWIYVPLDF